MSHSSSRPSLVARLQEFSVPLLMGVIAALVVANAHPELYEQLVHEPLHEVALQWIVPDAAESSASASQFDAVVHAESIGHASANGHVLGEEAESHDHHGSAIQSAGNPEQDPEHASDRHAAVLPAAAEHGAAGHDSAEHDTGHSFFSLAFIINDIFMVFFFGIAAKEITEAALPGGALNPPSKAINPLLATLGGVLGPIATFLALNACFGNPEWAKGWGIPTATDIALAWLVARLLFGKGHPAISFLLLLAIADDAIGLGIIAFAYPDPHHPVEWMKTLWIVPGMLLASGLRWRGVQAWWPYVAIAGGMCWWGLFSAHLHPALALVFVVPFIPGPKRDLGLYQDEAGTRGASPLERFEHDIKLGVDFGLFFFAFANAGVSLSGVSNLTWIILGALIIGKTVGITLFSLLGVRLGFPLPNGVGLQHLIVTGNIAGLGLTVALFVSNQAFVDPGPQGAAKMGALLSVVAAGAAFAAAQSFGVTQSGRRWQLRGWLPALGFRRQTAKVGLGGPSGLPRR